MDSPIPIGTTVTWKPAGFRFHVGTVLAFVPAWEHPLNALGRFLEPHERADGLGRTQSIRYLVAVPRGGKSELVDIYTPRASLVKVVGP